MEPRPTPEMLAAVASHIFEESAFVMLGPRAPGAVAADDELVAASIAFTGRQVRGSLELRVEKGIALEVASSMLAIEPNEIEAEHASASAIAEILNIMAGALAEKLVGTYSLCPIGIPVIEREPAPVDERAVTVDLEDMEGRALYVAFHPAVPAGE